MYNILSLALGIAAIGFSIHSLQVKGCLICCTVSGGLCGLSLLCQLIDTDMLAKALDSSALFDTAHARVLAGAVLLAVCTALNVAALIRGRKKGCNNC